MVEEFSREFIIQCLRIIDENAKKLITCLAELTETELWKRPNENSNSAGNLVLHLCGNIRQYVISSLGNRKDVRERDREFAASGGFERGQLIEKFTSTVNEAKTIIQNLSLAELLRTREVQGFNDSGIAIVVHVTEHLSYHTGQLIFWTKLLKNKDLGFYAGIDLNVKNKI